jgi:hypothetical protein
MEAASCSLRYNNPTVDARAMVYENASLSVTITLMWRSGESFMLVALHFLR